MLRRAIGDAERPLHPIRERGAHPKLGLDGGNAASGHADQLAKLGLRQPSASSLRSKITSGPVVHHAVIVRRDGMLHPDI
jgi:hypothetical protein